MDPAEILWSDSSCYAARYEKSAAALIAVEKTLAADSTSSTIEFRRLFEFIAQASPGHFTQLWSDPVAYYWVRRAVHFLAALRGAPMNRIEHAYCAEVGAAGAAEALPIHLADFKRFALALAILSDCDFSFAESYTISLPFALPGTQLVISGSGSLSIRRATRGRIDATYQGKRVTLPIADSDAPTSTPHITRCPCIAVGDVSIPLNPALFRLPGLGLSGEWTEPAADFQLLHSAALTDALALVAKIQPQTFAQFPEGMKTLALKPMHEGSFSSLSSSELPGAFICSVPCDRYELAATLIHEFHHNRLYFIEEDGAFFEASGEDVVDGENHYSPWRDGLRPLHGLFHALYVYLPVFRFWSAAVEAKQLEGDQLAYALDQLARIPVQLRIGVNQIRRHAHLMPFGARLFEPMATEVSAAESKAIAIGASLATAAMSSRTSGALRPILGDDHRPLSVGETLLDHLITRDLIDECASERRWLRGSLSRARDEQSR